jgi:hypothetical protein
MEAFLFALLRWPGCPENSNGNPSVATVSDALATVLTRLNFLRAMQGSSVMLVPLRLPQPANASDDRPLRACVIQTVFPGTETDFDLDDLEFARPETRTRHRRHLSAALAAVEASLALRETHKGQDGRLDWLILPELAVHPRDVLTHLVPFARAHRATILAGLTFERLPGHPLLVNSALWIVPTHDAERGLRVLIRRQGKGHLAPIENDLNAGVARIRGFRPCQWLIGYPWSPRPDSDPLWLTSAICYDATDIQLAADLKPHSDVFAVPALNRDVATFDQMAHALHYHMFQMVVVANNGCFGGSNAYAPYAQSFERQVFHLHGQPQASIAFFEIDDIPAFKNRRPTGGVQGPYTFKPAPAG